VAPTASRTEQRLRKRQQQGSRWFCGLGIEEKVPDHSAFSRNRNERFGESNILRELSERIVSDCIKARLVGGEGFAIDATLIEADANKRCSIRQSGQPIWA